MVKLQLVSCSTSLVKSRAGVFAINVMLRLDSYEKGV